MLSGLSKLFRYITCSLSLCQDKFILWKYKMCPSSHFALRTVQKSPLMGSSIPMSLSNRIHSINSQWFLVLSCAYWMLSSIFQCPLDHLLNPSINTSALQELYQSGLVHSCWHLVHFLRCDYKYVSISQHLI